MSKLTEKQLHELRRLLSDERKDTEEHLKANDMESLRMSTGELTPLDNHPADSGTEVFERGRDLAIHDSDQKRLEDIDRAFERMEAGTYGECEVCGEAIPYQRLEAIPWTRYCVEHTPDQNVSDDRPAEEVVVVAGRGKTNRHYVQEENLRDDNDAWRTVAGYGNSDSPAMADNPDEFRYTRSTEEEADGDGMVENYENFTGTDIDGNNRRAFRSNKKYKE